MFEKIFEKYNQIIFFDIETTGFNPEGMDQIIELAAISIDKTGRQQEMDEFIKLFRIQELPQKITELTGISSDTLSDQGKDEVAVLKKFINMLQNNGHTLLIAHNAQFDLKFMAYAIHRNSGCRYLMIVTILTP